MLDIITYLWHPYYILPPTLTKAHLIERIQSNNDLTMKQSTDIVEATIGIIKNTLATGEDVLISGFGMGMLVLIFLTLYFQLV